MDELEEMEIEKYVDVKMAIYESTEAVLKSKGLSWSGWIELCKRIEPAFPSEGVCRNGFTFSVEQKPIRQYPESATTVIGVSKSIHIHRERT